MECGVLGGVERCRVCFSGTSPALSKSPQRLANDPSNHLRPTSTFSLCELLDVGGVIKGLNAVVGYRTGACCRRIWLPRHLLSVRGISR